MTIDLNAVSEHDIIYFAGLFDGEGSISIHHSWNAKNGVHYPHALTIAIGNTHKGVVDWMHKTFGGAVCEPKFPLRNERTRPAWRWSLGADKAIQLLRRMYPYLIVKKSQADVAFEWRELVKRVDTRNPLTGKRPGPRSLTLEHIHDRFEIVKKLRACREVDWRVA